MAALCVCIIWELVSFSLPLFFLVVCDVFFTSTCPRLVCLCCPIPRREKRAPYSTGFPSPTRLAVLFSYILKQNKNKREKRRFYFMTTETSRFNYIWKDLMHQRVPFKPVVKKWNGSTLFLVFFLLCEIFINSESLMLFTGIKYWKFVNPFFFFPCLDVFFCPNSSLDPHSALALWRPSVVSACRKVDGISS